MNSVLRPLRPRDPYEHELASTQLKLVFDLVIVIAIASLTAAFHHALSEMSFNTAPGSPLFPVFGFSIFLVEWTVPNFAEPAGRTTWHRTQFIARFGLLAIIVLGEALLSIATTFGESYDGSFDMELVRIGLSAFIATGHSESAATDIGWFIGGPIVVVLLTIWLIRDRYMPLGARSLSLPIGAACFTVATYFQVPPLVYAALAIAILLWRAPLSNPEGQHP